LGRNDDDSLLPVYRNSKYNAYAPVTILINERTDGVHLSYDLMESLLASYGSKAALEVARELDEKIERLLELVSQ